MSSKPRNKKEWFLYLESLPSGLNFRDLKRITTMCERLKANDFTSTKIVTVAGTNGKGSCVSCLENIFLAAGYQVGAYFSPHLLNYNERIRINGTDVNDQELITSWTKVWECAGDLKLSYFDFTTLTAFDIFQHHDLDLLLLEVGLGGRFDPVNVLDSDISVITSISLDHTEHLGKTREEIAKEKVGIMRSERPLVYGDFDSLPIVFSLARKNNVPLYSLGRDFFYQLKNSTWEFKTKEQTITDLPLPRLSLASAAAALMTMLLLDRELPVTKEAIKKGLAQAYLLGRYQRINFLGKKIILDVAHNPAASEMLAKKFTEEKQDGKILAVLGMLRDKDLEGTIAPWKKIVSKWYLGTVESPRRAEATDLANVLLQFGIDLYLVFSNIEQALNTVIAEAGEKDTIVVFGSFYTVAKALREFV
jgi:dihydrofolate synthase / folylpolyglutamate synthase